MERKDRKQQIFFVTAYLLTLYFEFIAALVSSATYFPL